MIDLSRESLVGVAGFEPATPSSRTRWSVSSMPRLTDRTSGRTIDGNRIIQTGPGPSRIALRLSQCSQKLPKMHREAWKLPGTFWDYRDFSVECAGMGGERSRIRTYDPLIKS